MYKLLGSSVVEQVTVNHLVAGSSPARAAIFSMEKISKCLENRIEEIVAYYPDYSCEMYKHVFQATEFVFQQSRRLPEQHISSTQLMVEGVVPLAIKKWGMLAFSVFRFWGIETGADVGKIVARLVEFKVLKQDEEDRLEEFHTFQLEELFAHAFKNQKNL